MKGPKAGQGGVGQRALCTPGPVLQVTCVWAGSRATEHQVCTAGQTPHQPTCQEWCVSSFARLLKKAVNTSY